MGVSLALHVILMGGVNWRLPTQEPPAEPNRFEARLVSLGAPPPVAKPVVAAPPVYRAPLPAKKPVQTAAPPVDFSPDPIKVSASVEPVVSVDTPPDPVQVAAAASDPVELAPPPLNALPPRIDLRFQEIGRASCRERV